MITLTLTDPDATVLLAMLIAIRSHALIREPEYLEPLFRIKRELECALLLCDCHQVAADAVQQARLSDEHYRRGVLPRSLG